MRKVFYVLTLTVLFAEKVSSQSLSHQVVGVAGDFVSAGNHSLSFTVGETAVQTLASTSILTEGFQQPEKIYMTGLSEPSFSEVEIFPNPTTEDVYVRQTGETEGIIQLTDIPGRVLYSAKSNSDFAIVSMKNFPAGIYLLHIINEEGKSSSYKIFKVQ